MAVLGQAEFEYLALFALERLAVAYSSGVYAEIWKSWESLGLYAVDHYLVSAADQELILESLQFGCFSTKLEGKNFSQRFDVPLFDNTSVGKGEKM